MTTNTNSEDGPRLPGAEQAVIWLVAVVALPLARWLMGDLAPERGSLTRRLRRVADAIDQLEKEEERKKRERRKR
ncbi:hypothetical protein [Streptomyces sp. MJM8645]|uniref:hypothetical protein n=1 Tax=Streptomycetaceae TaxID=2062 RepID=UPI0007AFCDA6|nr:hypothetical protein [Streptomyces sp. MJM8645]